MPVAPLSWIKMHPKMFHPWDKHASPQPVFLSQINMPSASFCRKKCSHLLLAVCLSQCNVYPLPILCKVLIGIYYMTKPHLNL